MFFSVTREKNASKPTYLFKNWPRHLSITVHPPPPLQWPFAPREGPASILKTTSVQYTGMCMLGEKSFIVS